MQEEQVNTHNQDEARLNPFSGPPEEEPDLTGVDGDDPRDHLSPDQRATLEKVAESWRKQDAQHQAGEAEKRLRSLTSAVPE